MKIRQGFVTNSSSSSFVVVMKKDISEDEVKEKIESLFVLDNKHPLYNFSKQIVNSFLRELKSSGKFDSLQELFDYFYIDEDNEWTRLFVKYGNLRHGSFSDDTYDECETWLCNNSLNYEDDDIIILHDGGY